MAGLDQDHCSKSNTHTSLLLMRDMQRARQERELHQPSFIHGSAGYNRSIHVIVETHSQNKQEEHTFAVLLASPQTPPWCCRSQRRSVQPLVGGRGSSLCNSTWCWNRMHEAEDQAKTTGNGNLRNWIRTWRAHSDPLPVFRGRVGVDFIKEPLWLMERVRAGAGPATE